MGEKEVEEWFLGIYERCHMQVQRLAEAIVKDVYLAEDVVQNTFEAIMRHADKLFLEDNDTVYRMVIGTARHKAIDVYNETKRRQAVCLSEETINRLECCWARDCSEAVLRQEERREFVCCLLSLPEAYRCVLVERYVYQRSEKEIAEEMCLRYDLVRKRLERGRGMIRQMYGKGR